MTNYKRIVLSAVIIATFAVGSFYGSIQFSQAATDLNDAASISQNNTFTGLQNKFSKGIFIGEQGTGGVTYFNGTIANLTTDADGNGIPVTVGDDLRVDGKIWRGENSGTADDMPVQIDDNLEITGTINASAIPQGAVTQTKEDYGTSTLYSTDNGADFTTAESVTLTTGESTLLCMVSGTLAVDANNSSARTVLLVDGTAVSHTIRRGTSNVTNETFTLAATTLVNVSAGSHTVALGFNTDAGTTASLFNRTLDVVELKK